jgi:hypothetical protein
VQKLVQRFVPVADEVSRLQSQRSADCLFFQEIAEQGHFAGRTQPSRTRQGIYALAPGGAFLASLNTRDPRVMARMLRLALDRFDKLSVAERTGMRRNPDVWRWERYYPEDGLALKIYSRDLDRGFSSMASFDWRRQAWNQGFAWFTKEEARSFLAESAAVGSVQEVPEPVLRRLTRLHLVDNVRGQVSPFPKEAVDRAQLTSKIVAVEGELILVQFSGETRASLEGSWAVGGFADRDEPEVQKRGMNLRLLGTGKYDRGREAFVELEIVAVGTRFGGTQFNGRGDDLAPAPIGFVLQLAGSSPQDRVAPDFIYHYGWQKK